MSGMRELSDNFVNSMVAELMTSHPKLNAAWRKIPQDEWEESLEQLQETAEEVLDRAVRDEIVRRRTGS